jgi:UDP-N-acetylmuramate dehydrogenase
MRQNPQPPFYRALAEHLATEHEGDTYTPLDIRNAVIEIRTGKLPDPRVVANCGSFFANPIISADDFVQINADHPDAPNWPTDDGKVKLSAAWLLDQAGFKDYHDAETGMGTWPAQSLVLVNEHAKSTADLLAFKQKLVDAVQAKFNITLAQEPELLP